MRDVHILRPDVHTRSMDTGSFFHAERLLRAGEFAAAQSVFHDIVDAMPEHVAAWRGYAQALKGLGQTEAAARAVGRGNAVEADHISEVGAFLLFHGDQARSEICFTRALDLDPDCLSAHWLLGEFHSRRDDRDRALLHYRRCLEIAPDRTGPAYMIAALGAETSPDRAPDDYVTAFFDWYADHFDDHLTTRLNYTGPEQVAGALRACRPDGVGHALDLGCGTGLAGLAARDFANHWTGVDLSPAMLARAHATGVYDNLIEGDLLSVLRELPDASVDAALAADVFVYIGALEQIFAELARVLGPSGVFVATFETAPPGASWELCESGRYRHAEGYVRRVAGEAGLGPVAVSARTLREEYGEPVASLLITIMRSP
jgi:predicted TPR repeat methyltransferase